MVMVAACGTKRHKGGGELLVVWGRGGGSGAPVATPCRGSAG